MRFVETPAGPFERIGKILQQDPTITTGADHHCVIHAPDDASGYIVYHCRPPGDTDLNHRQASIDRMSFDVQGLSCR